MVEALLARGADIEAANKRNCTPLERALFNDTTGMVQLLLKSGANPNARPYLLVAVRTGNLELVRLLLDNGADTEAIDPAFGETALHLAAMSDSLEVARLLLNQEPTSRQEIMSSVVPHCCMRPKSAAGNWSSCCWIVARKSTYRTIHATLPFT